MSIVPGLDGISGEIEFLGRGAVEDRAAVIEQIPHRWARESSKKKALN